MNVQKILQIFTAILLFLIAFTNVSIQAEDKNSDQNTSTRDFHDYDSLTTALEEIASTYPDICNLYDLGQSVQGRSLWALKITDNPDIEENEVEIRFDGCHHGNEWMSVEMPLLLAWHLVENYSVDPTITEYVDNREIWIVPMVNPDGRQVSQRRNANNVDINRDYGYMWSGEGNSPSPFSQPETQAIRNHGLTNNIVTSYSYHTTAEYVNYLWDYKPQPSPDEPWIDMISQVYADLSGYIKTNGFDWYQTTGASDDGNYGCFGNINTIIETLNDDISDEWDRNRDAMLFAIDVVDMGLSGIVTDALTSEPIRASVWVEENNWPVFTDPAIGDYHKPLFEGTYHVHFRANGYEEQVKTITITDANASNILDAALVPANEYYAYQVTMCKYFSYNTNPTEGISALGPPDNISASLGDGGMMVLDMGNTTPIVDGEDDDFTIFEADNEPEGYIVSVSMNWDGPWQSLGTGLGTMSFDLADSGMNTARFVKIEDDGNKNIGRDTYPGFDLDAVQILSLGGPTLIFDPQSYNAGILNQNDTDTTQFQIWNEGLGVLNYSLIESCDWIEITPTSGNSSGEVDTIGVIINTTGLVPDFYQCDINIISNGGNNTFPVSVLIVEEGSEVIDVNQSIFDRGFRVMPGWDGAQGFIPSYTLLSSVEVYMSTWGSPWGPIMIQICENDPNGVVVFTDTISPGNVPDYPDFGWISVNVGISVTLGETYVLVLRDGDDGDTHNCLMWSWCDSYGGTGPYPDGEFLFRKLGYPTWLPIHDWDFTFKTYGYQS